VGYCSNSALSVADSVSHFRSFSSCAGRGCTPARLYAGALDKKSERALKISQPKRSVFAVAEGRDERTHLRYVCGASDKDPVWLEAVEGLSAAGERMEEIAAERPGEYFLFRRRATRFSLGQKLSWSLNCYRKKEVARPRLQQKTEAKVYWVLRKRSQLLGPQPWTLSESSWTRLRRSLAWH
jgi:hypothetical protein